MGTLRRAPEKWLSVWLFLARNPPEEAKPSGQVAVCTLAQRDQKGQSLFGTGGGNTDSGNKDRQHRIKKSTAFGQSLSLSLFFFFLLGLGFELRVSHLKSRHATT
jgi:hypothetical protein